MKRRRFIEIAIFLLLLSSQRLSAQLVGTYTSSCYDTGGKTDFLNISWDTDEPEGTSIKFQIATNNDRTTWNFLGPDGASDTYYTRPNSSIYTGHRGDRYIKYRTILTSQSYNVSPALKEVTITYEQIISEPEIYAYPNPCYGDRINFAFSLPEESSITINIYDLSFDLVKELKGKGKRGEITWNCEKIASGVYVYVFKADGWKETGRLIIIR